MISRRKLVYSFVVIASVIILVTVRINIRGHFDGIYILKGEHGGICIVDDVLMGEEDRLLWGVSLRTVGSRAVMEQRNSQLQPYLEYEWHTFDGSGFVRNVVPGGQKMVFCLSRFLDSAGKPTKGVFLGGGLPFSEEIREKNDNNDTGMASFDGIRWYHIWCNANEAIVTGKMLNRFNYPSSWIFDDSRIVEASRERIVISSRHRVMTDDSQLGVDRFALFEAGEPYFILAVRVRNIGQGRARYVWAYGDEPWLGNYGDCRGNVGWTEGRVHLYEGSVDTTQNSYLGMVDIGNPLRTSPGEKFTNKANFIEWLGVTRPSRAYFSNQFGRYAEERERVPLTSPDSRVIALEYGPENLQPGESRLYVLAVGKAYKNLEGFPVKPQIHFDIATLNKLFDKLH